MRPTPLARAVALIVALTSGATVNGIAQAPSDSRYVQFGAMIDSMATQAGWPMLGANSHREDRKREIRIWVGFGLSTPGYGFRIVEDASSVHGSTIAFWTGGREPSFTFIGTPAQTAQWRAEWNSSTKATRDRIQHEFACRHLWVMQYQEICEPPPPSIFNWSSLLGQLDSLGIMTLPDQATLTPAEPSGEDGETIVVEILSPNGFRAYSYWTPEAFDSPEARRAQAIVRAMRYVVMDIALRPKS